MFLTGNDKKYIKKYDLNMSYEEDKKIFNKYGGLWAIYSCTDSIVLNRIERECIQDISFYYKSNNDYIFLGKYDKYGVYNKNQELIFQNPFANNFIGYIDIVLEDPFYTGQYAYEDGTRPGGFEPYTKITINFLEDSIEIK